MRIEYYAGAMNDAGEIGELLVVRENGRQVSQTWTGVTFKTMREADRVIGGKNAASWAVRRRNATER